VQTRYEIGQALRERVPREAHAGWRPAADRPDPIGSGIRLTSAAGWRRRWRSAVAARRRLWVWVNGMEYWQLQ
jgi:hypothetical protein